MEKGYAVWSQNLSQEEVDQVCDIVVQGTITSVETELIPTLHQTGQKWTIKPAEVIRVNWTELHQAFSQSFSDGEVIFWTKQGQLTCEVGCVVRCSLSQHLNPDNALVLMPQHCSFYSVVDASSSKSMLTMSVGMKQECPEFGPIRAAENGMFISYGIFSEFAPHVGSLEEACRMWNETAVEVKSKITWCSFNPCYALQHYTVVMVPIPPVTRNPSVTTLADIITKIGGERPHSTSQYTLRVNSLVDWSAYDMATVLAHELGHGYGLDHFSDSSKLMYAALGPGEKKKPSNDEVDCVNKIY